MLYYIIGDFMNKETRTKNSIRNSSTSIITQVLTVIMDFAVKTIFIYTLGSEYLGINGLFANIITLLSLADLGIGIAIPYSLYKPLADNDQHQIQILMKFYRKIYTYIGIIVLVVGISLTPFLPFIIKEMPNIEGIYFIYILFVTHSALSYFFVYKRFLIESDQKGYIIYKISFICNVLLNITRVIILFVTKNYILFLFCSIIFVLIQNFWYSYKANQLYPFIKEKTNDTISKKDFLEIKTNVSALLIYKIGSVITNGTDNIIISKFIGLVTVGFYSNYILIINSLNNILLQIFNAMTASIGNLVATNNERSKIIYEKLNFFNFWIYSLCSICLFILINPFINLWIGSSYNLGFFVALFISLNFYIAGMQSVTNSFRTAYGLFYKAKFRPITMVILNIIISVILVKPFGVVGVLMGTIISRILTTAWLDPYIIYKYGFKKNPKEYYITYFYYLMIFILSTAFIYYITKFIPISNFIIWVIVAIIIVLLYNIIIYLLFHKTEEFSYFMDKIKGILKNFKKRGLV